MAAKVFISYRRDDSAGHAGRVHDWLAHEFGANLLFMDVDSIPLGSDFIKVLREEVGKCDTLLAVIGRHWLDARDAEGKRRLDNENDFVRVEIATALQRDIAVIPILLDGAGVPKPEDLPADLQGLSARNGLDVRHGSFHVDMNRLIGALKARTGGPHALAEGAARPSEGATTSRRRGPLLIAGFVAIACAGAAVAWIAMTPRGRIAPSTPAPNQQTAVPQPLPAPQASNSAPTSAPSQPVAAPPPAQQSLAPAPKPVVAPAPSPGKLSPFKVELLTQTREHALQPNDSFKECAACPVMTVIAPGKFNMGSPTTELGRAGSESRNTRSRSDVNSPSAASP